MLLAAQILLIIAGALLILDTVLIVTRKPNPIKGWPLPCPITLFTPGVGIILLSIAGF